MSSINQKVQGLELDSTVINIDNNLLSNGMSYVALSRVKGFSGLAPLGFDQSAISCSEEVKKEMARLQQRSQSSYDLEECKFSNYDSI